MPEALGYWIGSQTLLDGSVVLPGNWGRIKLLTRANAQSTLMLREYVLELVRTRSYSWLPSRFACAFYFIDQDDARRFARKNGRLADILYQIELVEPDPSSFITDWKFYGMSENHSMQDLEKLADLYWTGESPPNPEALTLSPLRIVRQLGQAV